MPETEVIWIRRENGGDGDKLVLESKQVSTCRLPPAMADGPTLSGPHGESLSIEVDQVEHFSLLHRISIQKKRPKA